MKREKKNELISCIRYLKSGPEIPFTPYPDYPPELMRCFGFLPLDTEYAEHAAPFLEEKKSVSELSRRELGAVLSFIQRGERFCDGHIASYVENGVLLALMLRLAELEKVKLTE